MVERDKIMKKVLKSFFLAIATISFVVILISCFAIGPNMTFGILKNWIFVPIIKELSPFRIAAHIMGPPMPPYQLTVDLSKKGNIYDTEIRIYDEGTYEFQFKFIVKRYEEDKGMDRDKMWEFLGDQRTSGTIVPVKLGIYKLSDNKKERIIDDIYNTNGMAYYALIRTIKVASLDKGIYQIRLETLEDFEFLVSREIYLEIRQFKRK
jgi:hypothetical protein